MLLGKVKEKDEQKVEWLPKDMIGVCQNPPLFKKKDIAPEQITIDELVNRMDKILFRLETKFDKSEYWIMEPHGNSGIYIWDNEV